MAHKIQKNELLKRFSELYPEPASELCFRNEYELLVSVMLSAQCTDKKVNQVTPRLFSEFSDFKKLSKAKITKLEALIRPINYYRTKAKHLVASAKIAEAKFKGRVPRSMAELRTMPGVGQKTANVVLNELGIEPTIPVDTHVFRVSRRLGLAKAKNVKLVEEELKAGFDSKYWRNLHHWLILHGRRVCKARNPLCSACELFSLCPSKRI